MFSRCSNDSIGAEEEEGYPDRCNSLDEPTDSGKLLSDATICNDILVFAIRFHLSCHHLVTYLSQFFGLVVIDSRSM